MMIARGTADNTDLLILGLTERNLAELLKGRPMVLRKETHGEGIPEGWEIIIFSGKDEDSMQRQLAECIGPNTRVHRDPKLNKT